jgi:hypothetical protein
VPACHPWQCYGLHLLHLLHLMRGIYDIRQAAAVAAAAALVGCAETYKRQQQLLLPLLQVPPSWRFCCSSSAVAPVQQQTRGWELSQLAALQQAGMQRQLRLTVAQQEHHVQHLLLLHLLYLLC